MLASSSPTPTFLAANVLGLCLAACTSSAAIKYVADAAYDGASDPGTTAASPPESGVSGDDAHATDLPPVPDAAGADQRAPADLGLADLATAGGDATDDALVRQDGSDVAIGCLANPFPQCNDDPISAAIMGTCQPDGTCKCDSYYVLNPSTGRCRYPPRDGAVGDTDALSSLCTGAYNSCQCSCCSAIGRQKMCYYPTLGETVAALAAADEERWASTVCGAGACSSGIHYMCCTPAEPEPAGNATYTASANIGGYDHLGISKAGADCASLSFIAPASAGMDNMRIETGGRWAAEGASFGPCGDAGAKVYANGALGTLTFRMSNGACVMDLHATLFAIDDSFRQTTARMDADGIPVPPLLSVSQCQ